MKRYSFSIDGFINEGDIGTCLSGAWKITCRVLGSNTRSSLDLSVRAGKNGTFDFFCCCFGLITILFIIRYIPKFLP